MRPDVSILLLQFPTETTYHRVQEMIANYATWMSPRDDFFQVPPTVKRLYGSVHIMFSSMLDRLVVI